MKRLIAITGILSICLIHTAYGQLTDSLQQKKHFNSNSVLNTFASPIQKGDLTNAVKKIQKELNLKSFVRIDSFYIGYQTIFNHLTDTLNFSQSSSRYQSASAHFVASVNKIPFNVSYQYQSMLGWPFNSNLQSPVISFNRDLFVKSLEDRIRSTFDVNSLVGERIAAIKNLKEFALNELKGDLQKATGENVGNFQKKINQLGDWKEIVGGDKAYFTKKLLGEKEVESLESYENKISRYQEKINNGEKIDTAEYNNLLKRVESTKTLQHFVLLIMKYKKKWDESGLIKIIQKMELEKDLQLKELLQNPSALSTLAKNKLSLQKIEKLFLSIKQLNTGAGANNISPLTLDQSLRTSGFDLETIGKGSGSFFATLGKLQELTSVTERAIGQGSLNTVSTNMAGISFGRSSQDSKQDQYSKVSIFSFATSSSNSGTNMFSPLSGSVARNFVFTLSRKIAIGSKGSLLTEVSKSASQQQNEDKVNGGSTGNSFAVKDLFNTNDFLSNMGLSVEYENEFPGIDLFHELSFKYTGDGYSNPGNSYLFSGSKELYNTVSKSFLNQKLNIIIKDRFKSYTLDNFGKHLNNSSHIVDVRWRFSRGNYVSIKFQPSYNASKSADGAVLNAVTTNRVAADLNIRAKIKKVQFQNFLNLAYLSTKTVFSGFGDEIYKTIQFTSTHSCMIRSQQFFVNTNFNYAFRNGSLPYLNNAFLMEAGMVYDGFGKIKLTTALNYNSVQDWYSQVVIKQGAGGEIGKKVSVNFSIDMAQNMKILQPYPVENLRWDLSFRYLIF